MSERETITASFRRTFLNREERQTLCVTAQCWISGCRFPKDQDLVFAVWRSSSALCLPHVSTPRLWQAGFSQNLTQSDPHPAVGLSLLETPRFSWLLAGNTNLAWRNSAVRAENNSAVTFVLAKLFSSVSLHWQTFDSSSSSSSQIRTRQRSSLAFHPLPFN